ncbi:MAG: CAP domain-containing protein [Anaerolineae bacterium]|nr:CAP domain-containing protein [Anaerolineae bacterium]
MTAASTPAPPPPDFATEVVILTNAERAKAGCPALAISPQLTQAAQDHSTDMAINDYFSHYSLDGRTPWDRIRATGYSYARAAENIAAGYNSPASVVAGWMNSDGHRANILNCALTEIGVGYTYLSPDIGSVNYHHYWTQVFATPQ